MIPSIFQQISIWIIVIPFLVGIMNYKGLNLDSKWIFLLVLAGLPPQILTAIINKDTRLLALTYNLYTPVEVGILYLVFISKFTGSASRLIVHLSAALFLVLYILSLLFLGLDNHFLNGLVCASYVIYMLWILLLLKQEYGASDTLILRENPFTWYFTAIVLYAPGRVATMALYHYIRETDNAVLLKLSVIDSLFNILLYVFFSVGLLIRRTH